MFDVAMTVDKSKGLAHLKNSIEKIDAEIRLATLLASAADGQTACVLVEIGDRKISIKRASLNAALKAFGILTP
jgi:hypothetical protein